MSIPYPPGISSGDFMKMMRLMYRAIVKKYWKILFFMAVISAVGCGTMSGMSSAYKSLTDTLQEYIDVYGVPDATITTEITKREKQTNLLALADVAEVNTRLMANTVMRGPSGRYFSIRAISYSDEDFQKFFFWETAENNEMDSVYLEYNFAKNNGFSAGDTISVRVDKEYRDYFVAGLVSAVETLNVMPIEGLRTYTTDFGYLYASIHLLENEVNHDYEDGLSEWHEKRQELTDAEQDAQTQYQDALSSLQKAEDELNEKKAEFAQKLPDLENQRAELEKTRAELIQKEQEIQEKRAELDEQQKELNDKKAELADQQQELYEKKAEADRGKQELEEKRAEAEAQQQELDEKRAEAESQQQELNEKRAEADAAKAELDESQAELNIRLADLNETEQTVQEQYQQVIDGHREATRQLIALQNTRQELLLGLQEIDKARTKAEETRIELYITRAELLEKRAEVQEQLNMLRLAQNYLSRVDDAVAAIDEAVGVKERVQAAVDEIDRTLSDLETMQRRLEQAKAALAALNTAISLAEATGMDTVVLLSQRQDILNQLAAYGISEDSLDSAIEQLKGSIASLQSQRAELIQQLSALEDPETLRDRAEALQSQLDALMESFASGGSVSNYILSGYIEEATSGLAQIDDGLERVNDGLWQINTGLAQANEKEAEILDGLAQIDDAEAQLIEALAQMEEARPQLDDARRQIWEGYLQIADYQAQIDDGYAQLADGYAQLADYQAQLDEGFAQIADYQAQLDEGFAHLDAYQTELDDGYAQIADYQAQIDDGQVQIADYQAQIDDGYAQIDDGLVQLTDGLAEIDEGLAQIQDGIADAERQLAEGEEEISKKRAEAEAAWMDAALQFDDLEQELKSAWAELSEWEGYDALCNQFLLRFVPDADPETALEAAKAALGDVEIKSAVPYAESGTMSRITNFVTPIGIMSDYMPVILFAVALVVVFLFISLMVRQCRREIGILRALGFSKGHIRLLFCCIAFVTSLFACVLGAGIGIGLSWYLGYCFAPIFPLPFYRYKIDFLNYGFACVLTMLVCQVSMILGTNLIGRVQPAEAMSRPAPSNAKTPALLRGALKNAAPFTKFCVSSLLRNKWRFLYSSFCLSCTVMLIFASIGYIGSKEKLMEENYDKRIRYDCQIFFSQYPNQQTLDEMASLGGLSDIQRLAFYTEELEFGGSKEKIFLNALDERSDMIGIYDENQNVIPLPREGIILEKHQAEKMGIKPGDTVTVGGVPMQVTAISNQTMSYMHYISLAQAEALKEPNMEVVLCRVEEASENDLLVFLKDQDTYVFSIFTHSVRQTVDQLFSSYDAMSYLLIAAASVLGMVIIVTTAKSNLLEQKRELCVLRTLGFQHSQISRNWFLQSFLQFLFSCGAGLLAGQWVEREALSRLGDSSREFPIVNEPWLYLFTLSLVLAFVIVSHWISMYTVKQWDLVESVKDKE